MELEKLIRVLRYVVLHLPWSKIREDANRVVEKAIATLEAQQTRIRELEEQRRWIPVGERLPEVRCWCEDDDDGVHTRYYRSDLMGVCWGGDCYGATYNESRDVIDGQETNVQVCWISQDHGELVGVTHWIPLPEEVD